MSKTVTDKDIEEFEKLYGVELTGSQKEMVRKILDKDEIYISMFPRRGYIQAMRLSQLTRLIFGFGERNFEQTKNDN